MRNCPGDELSILCKGSQGFCILIFKVFWYNIYYERIVKESFEDVVVDTLGSAERNGIFESRLALKSTCLNTATILHIGT